MSNSLLLRHSYVLLILFFVFASIFSLCFVSAVSFSVSPPSIELISEKNREVCTKYDLISSDELKIGVEDRWSNLESRRIGDYVMDGAQEGLLVKYDSHIELDGSESFRVCMQASEDGKYNGVLVFNVLNSSLSLGSWIVLKVGKYEFLENKENPNFGDRSSLITGDVIADSVSNTGFVFAMVLMGNLLVILMVLLLIIRRQKRFIY